MQPELSQQASQPQRAYRVPRHPAPVDLRLDGNEGQVVCDDIVQALEGMKSQSLREYPSTRGLEEKIAELYQVSSQQVLVTAGADDGLLRMCRAFLSPASALLLPVPTFEMIERFAAWCFAPVKTVPWPGEIYPTDDVIEAFDSSVGLVAVVSPNNPTGGTISSAELRRLSAALPDSMLMVDCAYAEFAEEDITQTALGLPNAVVFRTVSKALGLAGLRVGFALGPAPIIERLRSFGMPYPVSAPSIILAGEGIDRRDGSTDYVDTVRAERAALKVVLDSAGLPTQASQGNFVLARTQDPVWWRDGLAGLGISARVWPNSETLGDAIRITCPGQSDQFERLKRAIETIERPEAILFDIDGVLADVSQSYRAAIEATASEFGVVVDGDDIEVIKREGQANNDWLVTQRLIELGGRQAPFDQVKATFESFYWGSQSTPGFYLTEKFIGEVERLRALACRYPLAAVTGRPRSDAMLFLERFGVLDCFSAVVTMDDGPAKPEPFPVQLALQRLGVKRAWMLGDTRDDIEAARASAVLPLGIIAPGRKCGAQTRSHLLESGAARVFNSWMDVEDYLP